MIYVDSSALIKRYVSEADSERAEAMLLADRDWVTAQHAYVEIACALARRIAAPDVPRAMAALEADWSRTAVVALDDALCRRAARIGIESGVRMLDALHLAAAERVGMRAMAIVTFDLRLAIAGRALGFPVLGA